MLHKYKYNGLNIVLDVNSGAIHVVDDVAYEMLSRMEEDISAGELVGRAAGEAKDVQESLDEINELKSKGLLFSEDPFDGAVSAKRPVIKALCLHIAHDCNMKCEYCFAEEGEYRGERSLMTAETGKRALDFVVERSGSRTNLEIDFFGGEPTINFNAVTQIVEYGRSLEKIHNKNFRFTLTTNALNLTDEIIDYCNAHMSNVVLSIDGRAEVNDKMRKDKSGNGSYKRIVANIERFVEKRGGKDYFVRGTFTSNNLDFSKDVLHLYGLGFKQISIEPVVAPEDAEYALKHSDVPAIFSEYERLTELLLKYGDINFFHFNIDLTGGSCVAKRLSGCGAGCEYMSVAPDGSVYPCHQFAGLSEFKIGSVYGGQLNERIISDFAGLNVYSKKECKACWAKFYCSGGCAANAYQYGGNIYSCYDIGCELQKKRIECAIYLQIVKNGLLN